MKNSRHKITGILLAGGKSSRMGRDKGMIRLGKYLMYQYPLKVLESLCDEILISTCNPMEIEEDYEQVCDNLPGIGPIGGVATCLEKSSSDLNIIVSCDLPLVNRELFAELLKYSGEPEWPATSSPPAPGATMSPSGTDPSVDSLQVNAYANPVTYDVILPAASQGRPEPLCGIYRKSAAAILQQMIDREIFAMHQLLNRANAKIVHVDASHPFYHDQLFRNVNSESDLSRLPGHML